MALGCDLGQYLHNTRQLNTKTTGTQSRSKSSQPVPRFSLLSIISWKAARGAMAAGPLPAPRVVPQKACLRGQRWLHRPRLERTE